MDNKILVDLYNVLVRAVPTIVTLLTLYGVLNFVLFRPLVQVLEERYRKTEGARQAAADLIAQAAQRTDEYENRIRAVKQEMYREIEEARKRAIAAQAKTLEDARHRAAELLASVQEELDRETAKARQALTDDTEKMADQLADRLMRGKAA